MTRQKSFKSRVRARMAKTGESYTTARGHLLSKVAPSPAEADQVGESRPAAPAPSGEAIKALAMSDASMVERTGRSWDDWFKLLDAWGATARTHLEITRWLDAEHQVDNWSRQSIAVGYEQARGMRAPGQGSDGYYTASVSKTVAVPVDRLFAAFADAELRERWLPATLEVGTVTPPKWWRAAWQDGSTRIAAGFVVKGDGKSQVGIAHEKLADAAAAAEMKAYWRERLAALKQLLEA